MHKLRLVFFRALFFLVCLVADYKKKRSAILKLKLRMGIIILTAMGAMQACNNNSQGEAKTCYKYSADDESVKLKDTMMKISGDEAIIVKQDTLINENNQREEHNMETIHATPPSCYYKMPPEKEDMNYN